MKNPENFLGDESSLLVTLNLCAIRGHSLNCLADMLYREFVAPSSPSPSPPPISNSLISSKIDSAPKNVAAGEEAVNMYLSALAIYQMGIESAMEIWRKIDCHEKEWNFNENNLNNTKTREFSSNYDQSSSSSSSAAVFSSSQSTSSSSNSFNVHRVLHFNLSSLSTLVTWIKNRFNECFERASEIKLAIGDHDFDNSFNEHENVAEICPRAVEKIVYQRALDIVSTNPYFFFEL